VLPPGTAAPRWSWPSPGRARGPLTAMAVALARHRTAARPRVPADPRPGALCQTPRRRDASVRRPPAADPGTLWENRARTRGS